MAGYCTLVLYFHSPAAHENTAAHSCNIQPYYLLTHQIIYISSCNIPLWWNFGVVCPKWLFPLPFGWPSPAPKMGWDHCQDVPKYVHQEYVL